MFFCEFCEISKNTCFPQHSGRLLLEVIPPKKCSANVKQKPQENTHAEEWSPQRCICNFIEIIPPHRCSPANWLHTHRNPPRRTSPEGCFCIDIQLVKNLKLDFVRKKLSKSKNWWDHCFSWLWLLETFLNTTWQNFLVRVKKLTCHK